MDLHPEALAAKAQRLFALHKGGLPLMLLNAWDAGSARLFEARGAAAIGTTSAGVAFALGRADGSIERDEMLEATARIAAAVERARHRRHRVRVRRDARGVGETVERVLAAGAVGINLEDSAMHGDEPLRPHEAAARVAAARAAAERAGVPLSSTPAPTSTGCASARSPRGSSARSSGSRPTSRPARTASSPPA